MEEVNSEAFNRTVEELYKIFPKSTKKDIEDLVLSAITRKMQSESILHFGDREIYSAYQSFLRNSSI